MPTNDDRVPKAPRPSPWPDPPSVPVPMLELTTFDVLCKECGGVCASDVTGAHWHVTQTECMWAGKLRAWYVKYVIRAA